MDAGPQNLYFSNMSGSHQKRGRSKPSAPVPAFFLYGEAPQAPDEATVHVETIAARSRLHDWTIEPHRHRDLHQIIVVHAGNAQVDLDRHRSTLEAPGIIHAPPGVVHGFRFQANTVGWVCSFASGLAKDLSGRSGELRRFLESPKVASLSQTTFLATDLLALSAMLLREFERSALGRESVLRGLLTAWVTNVYRVSQTGEHDSAAVASREREIVATFRQAVESRFREHAPLAIYCRSIGVSDSQLRRACLAVTGQAPAALIQLRMLVEAERQLRYTAMSVSQVAYYLGFEDPAYFSRFFRRRTGLPPKSFRAGRS